jgi:hypothetical protein
VPLLDILSALATLAVLLLLFACGGLAALRLLGARAARDRLAFAVAALLATNAIGVGVGLLLGALGALRLELALPLVGALTAALLFVPRRLTGDELRTPLALLARRTGDQLAAYPALAVVACHAVASEALRGLLRPPLSWDALMYHLLLAARWLQRGDLAPVLGPVPINYYGFAPGNGAIWLWWWMAPSHGELYVNLAFLPQWLLLGLAAGGMARQLGARRWWPLASFLVATTPAVVRFAATPYVDIPTAACLLAAAFFALLWLEEPRWSTALLCGPGLGLAAGTKVLGLAYAAALAAAALLLARGGWRRRLPQAAAALALAALLGGYFYLRNAALGTDPLAAVCESTARGDPPGVVARLPRAGSIADLPRAMLGEGQLLDALLGTTRPVSLELGFGPQTLLLLVAAAALPWGLERARRRAGLFVWLQVLAHLAFWLVVPYAGNRHVYANPRYLLATLGLAAAGGVALAEARLGARDRERRWLDLLVLALLAQDLLQLAARMPRGVRLALAVADLAALVLVFSPRLRTLLRARWRLAAAAALAAALLATPAWARFRLRDRPRALRQEFTAHATDARLWAPAWKWLDRHGGTGTVAVAGSPRTSFVYPAMGPRLERRVVYVNVNRANHRLASDYPRCDPRVGHDAAAWIANLRRAGVRWVHVQRHLRHPFPPEAGWAAGRPDLFRLRFSDAHNRIYEVLPPPSSLPHPDPSLRSG